MEEPKNDLKTESKIESKTELKTDSKTELKTDSKTELKTELITDVPEKTDEPRHMVIYPTITISAVVDRSLIPSYSITKAAAEWVRVVLHVNPEIVNSYLTFALMETIQMLRSVNIDVGKLILDAVNVNGADSGIIANWLQYEIYQRWRGMTENNDKSTD